jgi:hypothetical protein
MQKTLWAAELFPSNVQGILTEGKGSVRLTSSLWYLVRKITLSYLVSTRRSTVLNRLPCNVPIFFRRLRPSRLPSPRRRPSEHFFLDFIVGSGKRRPPLRRRPSVLMVPVPLLRNVSQL